MIAPFSHVGLVVPELGQAQRDLSSTLGLGWASQQRRTIPVRVDGTTLERTLRFVYSREGPPYVELIEADEPPWDLREGLHHMGLWSEDILADIEGLVAGDFTLAATGVDRRGRSGGFAYLSSPTGLLVELVDQRGRAAFDRWIAGGEYR